MLCKWQCQLEHGMMQCLSHFAFFVKRTHVTAIMLGVRISKLFTKMILTSIMNHSLEWIRNSWSSTNASGWRFFSVAIFIAALCPKMTAILLMHLLSVESTESIDKKFKETRSHDGHGAWFIAYRTVNSIMQLHNTHNFSVAEAPRTWTQWHMHIAVALVCFQ